MLSSLSAYHFVTLIYGCLFIAQSLPPFPSFHLIRSAQCSNLNQSSLLVHCFNLLSVPSNTSGDSLSSLCVHRHNLWIHTHTHLETPKSIEARLHHHRLHLRRRCLRLRGVGGALAIKSQSMHTHTNVVVVLTDWSIARAQTLIDFVCFCSFGFGLPSVFSLFVPLFALSPYPSNRFN